MTDYSIDPMTMALVVGKGCFVSGDLIDMLTGATIVGAYCEWPKKECAEFVIVGIDNSSIACKMLDEQIMNEFVGSNLNLFYDNIDWSMLKNSPEWIEKFNKEYYNEFKEIEGHYIEVKNIVGKKEYDLKIRDNAKGKKKKDWQYRYPWEK